jgi:hypothetical protein
MDVALRAAKEVEGDILAPDLYRAAYESAVQAKKEYRLKNFLKAKELADRARTLAEKAEFESIRNGAKREMTPADPLANP